MKNPLGRNQVSGIKTLREAVVDRLEAGDGVGGTAQMVQEAGEACCRASDDCPVPK
jgi:hypothetical protein